MGGGGLRILGHKKWHVWTKDNIERVQRDERLEKEKADKEIQDQQKRQQDFQWEQLQQQRKRLLDSDTSYEDEMTLVKQNHIHLFEQVEKNAKNEQHEAEKKALEMTNLKKQGLAPMGLGQSVSNKTSRNGKQRAQPWYTYEKGTAPTTDPWGNVTPHQRKRDSEVDPWIAVQCDLEKSKPRREKTSSSKHDFTREIVSTKRQKKEKKKRRREKEAKVGRAKEVDVEKLRRARIEREERERKRAKLVLLRR